MTTAPEQDHTRGCGWAMQDLRLPVSWYEALAAGTGCGYPISGDHTKCAGWYEELKRAWP